MGIAAVMCVKALYWTAVIRGYCTTLMMLIKAHPKVSESSVSRVWGGIDAYNSLCLS